jgi:ATP-dependent DNA helicase DinG
MEVHCLSRYPFEYDHSQSFVSQVSEWVGDVFYDILPNHGFEIRDEQIYMSYQLAQAFENKQTVFAEAGVGTGKTLVYLLYTVCYARYMRKPVVISCADESLIEQLLKPEGDIAKLARYLDLAIDARPAKSPNQYACLVKLDHARIGDSEGELFQEIYEQLPGFVRSRESLQEFTAYGDRKDYPHLNDDQWSKINWDVFQDCFICDKRHRCGQTLSRDHYRRAADLILCSHDFYMEHFWTYEARIREGQLPLLPDHCAVVFDEGHLLEEAAQEALTYKIKHSVFEERITRLLNGEIRESLAVLVDEAISQSETVFEMLKEFSQDIPGSARKQLTLDVQLLREIHQFIKILENIGNEMALEGGIFTLNDYSLRIVEEHMEMMVKALLLFDNNGTPICWTTDSDGETTLYIMPRMVKGILGEQLFSIKMPVIFSSATLSVDGSFRYMAESLGIGRYLSFSVSSPFDYVNQMEVFAPEISGLSGSLEQSFEHKMQMAVRLLNQTGGRALILFRTKEELQRFKQEIGRYPECESMTFWFEGDRELSFLTASFQREEESVLCSVSLWEGLDVPGPSLSCVIIWSLPFPPMDPIYTAKRKEAANAFEEIDLPYMLLRLRQGMGRLIRTRKDSGIVTILGEELHQEERVRALVEAALPEGVGLKGSLNESE